MNAKHAHRLYCFEGQHLPNKTPKRKVFAKLHCDRTLASRQNEVCAMDFMSDQLFDGTRLRILTIVDAHTRFSPTIDARRSYKAEDVVNTLKRITRKYGLPRRSE